MDGTGGDEIGFGFYDCGIFGLGSGFQDWNQD